ncbi:MAG: acyl carrier protein [Proteobacteria bacterium]|nr:acyl carrier protein [Pseudomonadota bacterium]
MPTLEHELKMLIIEALDLEDITPDDIDSNAALFGDSDGLGLDSIDALELGVALRKKYGLQLEAGDTEVRESFRSIATLAAFVEANRKTESSHD